MNMFSIYLLLQLDSISDYFDTVIFALIVVLILTPFLFGGVVMARSDRDISSDQAASYMLQLKNLAKWSIVTIIVVATLQAFLPTTGSAIVIVGADAVLQNENMRQIPDNLAQYINQELKKKIDEVSK